MVRAALAALVLLVVAAVIFPYLPHRHYPNPRNCIVFMLRSLDYQYRQMGLAIPARAEDYLCCELGASERPLNRGMRVSTGFAHDLKITSRPVANRLVVEVRLQVSPCRSMWSGRSREIVESITLPMYPQGQTEQLLLSAIGGTRYWKEEVGAWIKPHAGFPQNPQVFIPRIGFNIPKTKDQFEQYCKWLQRVCGFPYRFRDGWGRRISLTLEQTGSGSLLVARSAGPDGVLNTGDDMVAQRHTTTGRVVGVGGVDGGWLEERLR